MSHHQQLSFIKKTKDHFPEYFRGCSVLEVGSLNINGTVRIFFNDNKSYLGIDLIEGKDVDLVCPGNELDHADGAYDTTISTECFEHDSHWKETFANMYRMTRSGGILMFTCASEGRHEHGTTRTSPADSPATNDYYRNLVQADFEGEFNIEDMFSKHLFEYNPETCDLYFWGIKK
jgi:SAM-dependent methyltransferase